MKPTQAAVSVPMMILKIRQARSVRSARPMTLPNAAQNDRQGRPTTIMIVVSTSALSKTGTVTGQK